MTHALVLLAHGAEEMEAVIIIDTLRRAQWDVVVASIEPEKTIACSRRVRILADASLSEIDTAEFDHIILPGGAGGTAQLCANPAVQRLLSSWAAEKRRLSAICAAPLALQHAGALSGTATCHPAVREQLTAATWVDERVHRNGNILTSQGPGTAFEFALELIRETNGPAAAEAVEQGLILP